ncbi:DUF6088 family protein [Cupriavidus sp. 30B13]|uniref:DUF6088 family protein n=1 Tax=Cupriavidus sp. 30B13 TaxID=3384241 RepID=UPI003B8ED653
MSALKSRISASIDSAARGQVWVPSDFAGLGNRDAIDKALQRMVAAGELRRIERGLYDRPTTNRLTKKPSTPDYRAVIAAIARRDQLRVLVDGLTAANDLGLTDAVPARVIVHTDARRRGIRLGNLDVQFKHTAPSRLYWAGRPAMRVVQALHWLKDMLASDRDRILDRLRDILAGPANGDEIREDLAKGLGMMPAWMQEFVRDLLRTDMPPAQRKPAPGPLANAGE